jgi:hypothetical protein
MEVRLRLAITMDVQLIKTLLGQIELTHSRNHSHDLFCHPGPSWGKTGDNSKRACEV